MLARMQLAREKDEGFSLIELLVVMIIIGILAAIAIPIFLSQRASAKDATAKSDGRTIANALESYYTNHQAYAAPSQSGTTVTIGTDTARASAGDTITVVFNGTAGAVGSSNAFCVLMHESGASHDWVYQSNNGGLQPATTTTCDPAAYGLTTPA